MGAVYKLTFANGKAYVGITTQAPRTRYHQHASLARNGAQTAVYLAWRKYGAPTLSILAEMPNDQLHAAEVEWVASLGTLAPGGYNTTPGGEVSPMLTRSVVERIAAKRRGQKHTPEARAKMSASQTGRPGPNKGKTFGEDVRAKMSAAHQGRIHTPEARAKMGAAKVAYWAKWRAERDAAAQS